MTDTPDVNSSVVPREIECFFLTRTLLHNLGTKAANVLSAYVMAPNRQKIWTVFGPVFGDKAGNSAIITRSLYGLNFADAASRAHLAH